MDFSNTVFTKNKNTANEEITISQTALCARSMRSLPNILRNKSSRTSRNYKVDISNKIDTSFTSNEENLNTSFDLNMRLSSLDSREDKYNKTIPLKSYHQRKQIHNPLNIRYEVPLWNVLENDLNNNRDKHMLQMDDQINTSDISLNSKTSVKKLKYNSGHKTSACKYSRNKKPSRHILNSNKVKGTNKKASYESESVSISNMENTDVLDANNLSDAEVFIQSTSEYHTSDIDDLNDTEIKFDNNIHSNDEIYNLGTECYINYNSVISDRSTEFITRHKNLQTNVPTYEFSITEDSLQEEFEIDRKVPSNLLVSSDILYTCTCNNCTSLGEDVILYEDSATAYVNNDMETEFYMPYEFYTNDYYHIFGESWLKDLDKDRKCFEEVQEKDVTKENTYSDNDNITELNESNVLSTEQNESQNLQPGKYNRMQNFDTELYSTEFEIHSNSLGKSLKYIKDINETSYINLEDTVTQENKISQNRLSAQTTNLINIVKSKCQTHKNKKDLYLNQCIHCKKLFHESNQFRKHLTYCNFCKEDLKCCVCNKIYRYKASLIHHLRKVHHILRP